MRDVTTETHAGDDADLAVPGQTPPPTTKQSSDGDPPSTGDWHDPVLIEGGGRSRRWLVGGLAGIALLLVGGVLTATNLPGGTTLAGTPLTSADDVPAAVALAAEALQDLPITFTTEVGSSHTVRGGELGLEVDIPATVSPVVDGLPSVGAWWTRLVDGRVAAPLEVRPLEDAVADRAAAATSAEPVNAQLDVRRSGIETTPGSEGIVVSDAQLQQALDLALDGIATTAPAEWPDPLEVRVDGQVVPPQVTQADIDGITEVVNRLEAAEVVVTGEVPTPALLAEADDADDDEVPARIDQDITLTGGELRQLVDVEAVDDAPEGQRLRLVPDPGGTPPRLVALMDLARIAPELDAHIENRSPTPDRGEDASDVSGVTGDIVVDAVEPGFEPNREETLRQVIEAALAGGGRVEITGNEATDVDPADLGIVEPVSTFTTYYTAGQSRVQNIRRIAEIVDGVIVPAGESFEVNHFVGRRTVANGFTTGGAILDGELVNDIGGGVSQFATTFFNAAWFAGIELVDFKAHSFYFSRYPPGREATINYPNVNLEIRNDTPHAILIDTDSDATSVTVTFWSTPYWDVETVMGPCQCGGAFRVTNQRILTSPGGQPVTEEYTTIYTVPRDS